MAAHSDHLFYHGGERSCESGRAYCDWLFLKTFDLKKESSKPTPVNPLIPSTEQEKLRKLEGDRNKEERLLAKRQALEVSVPTPDEISMIHQFFMADHAKDGSGFAEGSVPMSETHQRSLIFCSHQQRNIHNKVNLCDVDSFFKVLYQIFGGYLMRKAFELAFSTAFLFAGRRPFFSALGDITFNSAVPIGALLDLRSAVVYTEKNDIQVREPCVFMFFC